MLRWQRPSFGMPNDACLMGGISIRSSTMPTYRYAVEIQGNVEHIRTTPEGHTMSVRLGWPAVRAEDLRLNNSGLELLGRKKFFVSRTKEVCPSLPTAFGYHISPDECVSPPLDSPSLSAKTGHDTVQFCSSSWHPMPAVPAEKTLPNGSRRSAKWSKWRG